MIKRPFWNPTRIIARLMFVISICFFKIVVQTFRIESFGPVIVIKRVLGMEVDIKVVLHTRIGWALEIFRDFLCAKWRRFDGLSALATIEADEGGKALGCMKRAYLFCFLSGNNLPLVLSLKMQISS